MLTLPQEIAAALLVKRIGDGANDAAQRAGEANETLNRIEQQNKELLKKIQDQEKRKQEDEIERLRISRMTEAQRRDLQY
jgi:flagellar motility protein MotE (MotC chaperone)